MPAIRSRTWRTASRRFRKSRSADDWFDKFQRALEQAEEVRQKAEEDRIARQKAWDEAQEKTRQKAEEDRIAREKAWDEARQKDRAEAEEARKKAEEARQKDRAEAEEARKKAEEAHEKGMEEIRKAHRQTERTLNQAISDLSRKLGSIVESIMTPDLPNKFRSFGFTFNQIVTVKWTRAGHPYAQIDGFLENGAQAMAVEVKTTLRRGDVDEHSRRMEKVRVYADEYADRRQFYAAIAAMTVDEDTRRYALSQGFFLIEPSGEDVTITAPASAPKIW